MSDSNDIAAKIAAYDWDNSKQWSDFRKRFDDGVNEEIVLKKRFLNELATKAADSTNGGKDSNDTTKATSQTSPASPTTSTASAEPSSSSSLYSFIFQIDTLYTIFNIFITCTVLLYFIPSYLVPTHLQYASYYRAISLQSIKYGCITIKKFGLPNLNTIKTYYYAVKDKNAQDLLRIQARLRDRHFTYFTVFLMLSTMTPGLLVAIVTIIPSAYSTIKFFHRLITFGPRFLSGILPYTQRFLISNEEKVLKFVAMTEIFIFFWAVMLLFTPNRGILFIFFYIQFLSSRYRISPHSRDVVDVVVGKVEDLLQRPWMPSMLSGLYYRAKSYVLRMGGAQRM